VQNVETSALKALRSGFFYLFIAMTMLNAVAGVNVIFTFTYVPSLAGVMLIFITTLLLGFIIVFLYAVFGKIRPGMRQLSEVDNGFRICYTGTTLMLVGLAMLAFGAGIGIMVGVAMATRFAEMENVIGMVLALGWFYASYIIAFVGYLLAFVVGAFKLYGKYRNPLYMATGILFVLNIFLTPIGLRKLDAILTLVGLGITAISYFLMYIALGDTIKKLTPSAVS
jgi:hypothetical protein